MAEIGRVTTCLVSAYNRTRVHDAMLTRRESRTLKANFNGAIPAGVTITSANWRCEHPQGVAMSNAAISTDRRSTLVRVVAQDCSGSPIKVSATLSNGDVFTQVFMVQVQDSPWFEGEPTAVGAAELTVTA